MKPFIIAEIGVNHDGSVEKAIRLVDAAKSAGASAAKFQSFSANRLATEVTPKVEYQKIRDGQRTHFEMLKQLELSFSDQTKLKKYCDSIGIEFISTPYAIEDAIFLNSINVNCFKTFLFLLLYIDLFLGWKSFQFFIFICVCVIMLLF